MTSRPGSVIGEKRAGPAFVPEFRERTDGSTYPTGYWAEELAAPHEQFVKAGFTVDFTSPGGVPQPLDEHSADPAIAGPDAPHFVAHAQQALRDFGPLLKIDEVNIDDYAAVVLPGGHGPVVDLYQDADPAGCSCRQMPHQSALGGCHGGSGAFTGAHGEHKRRRLR